MCCFCIVINVWELSFKCLIRYFWVFKFAIWYTNERNSTDSQNYLYIGWFSVRCLIAVIINSIRGDLYIIFRQVECCSNPNTYLSQYFEIDPSFWNKSQSSNYRVFRLQSWSEFGDRNNSRVNRRNGASCSY